MLILLSPAKTLDTAPTERYLPVSKPALYLDAKTLALEAKKLSQQDIAELMGISDALAETARGYFQDWKQKWDAKAAKPAVLMFRGDVYQGLDADSLSDEQLVRAQDRLRILSGLYGILRPLDLVQPYRLEMGCPMSNSRSDDLYGFWREPVTEAVEEAAASTTSADKQPIIVNLASNEYFKAIDKKSLDARIVTPAFKERKNGAYKMISFFAKRARGEMARWAIEHRAESVADLIGFDSSGYIYNPKLSAEEKPVFTRDDLNE